VFVKSNVRSTVNEGIEGGEDVETMTSRVQPTMPAAKYQKLTIVSPDCGKTWGVIR
jgi:hypothetical protein